MNTNENVTSGKYELQHDGEFIYVITEDCLESYFRGDKKEYPNWSDILEPAFKSFETASKFLAANLATNKLAGDQVVIHQNDNGMVYMAEVTHSQMEDHMEYITVTRYEIQRVPLAE